MTPQCVQGWYGHTCKSPLDIASDLLMSLGLTTGRLEPAYAQLSAYRLC